MQTVAQDISIGSTLTTRPADPRRTAWTGRIIGGLAVAFLIFDSIGKLLEVQVVVDGAKQLGYAPDIVFGLGVTLLSCVTAYLVPRTSVLGAVLLTGYLGGAVATHVRVGNPFLTHVLFPTYVAALLWSSLILRDARLRALLLRADRSRS
jgi:DoxX-like family